MPIWPVVPASPPVVASPEEDALARLLRGVPRSVTGRGVVRPFRRNGRGDFYSATGAELVEAAIVQILTTRASSARNEGEIPWRTEFGSLTYMLRHGGNDERLRQIAKRYVAGALVRWIPRARVTDTSVRREKNERDDDMLVIYVGWVLRRDVDPRSEVLFSGTARAPLPMAA